MMKEEKNFVAQLSGRKGSQILIPQARFALVAEGKKECYLISAIFL
jgi:3'-phosphoadenosine 5'-phosphosulfate (PAPS) 3'-phosphatase